MVLNRSKGLDAIAPKLPPTKLLRSRRRSLLFFRMGMFVARLSSFLGKRLIEAMKIASRIIIDSKPLVSNLDRCVCKSEGIL